ncbi:hypothetical protein GX411_05195 [Candidatus Fermentibacteria bacterium]|nr:hypothetical protein [Candidatus Fermentibacteria bacterium]
MNLPSESLGMLITAAVLICSPQSCGPDQPAQDAGDQERLRQIFAIPGDAELASYSGFPPTMGFGQREGLSISACYLLTDEQEESFLENAPAMGWKPLPIPAEVRQAIPFEGLEVPLDLREGLYTCRTSGDNVLWASETRPVEDAEAVLDILLGVLDTAGNRLHVQVRAGY